MWHNTITPEDVRGRSRVDKLVLVDLTEAIAVAKAIKHPWYRCQSLTKAAEHATSRDQKLALLHDAFDAAQLQEEINRAVTVSAWPLRVLALLAPEETHARVLSLVRQASQEPHTLRRADALFALASSVQSNTALLRLVVPSLTQALLNGRGWRIDRLIRATAIVIKDQVPDALKDLVAHHSENGKKRKLIASLEGHKS